MPWMAGMYTPPGTSGTNEEEGIPVSQGGSPAPLCCLACCAQRLVALVTAWQFVVVQGILSRRHKLHLPSSLAPAALPSAGQDPRPQPSPPASHCAQQRRCLEGVLVW